MIHNLELEQFLLGALIKYPDEYSEIENFITEEDFYADENQVNRMIFMAFKQSSDKGDSIDPVLLAQKLKSLNISFPQEINISDYIYSLTMRATSASQVLKYAREVAKITVARKLCEGAKETISKIKKNYIDLGFDEVVSLADETFNKRVNLFDNGPDRPVDLYEEIPDFVEERGNNPIEEFGLSGPFTRIQENYGSLLREGNITCIVARAGSNKTTLALDFCTKVAENHNVPVLHFDNGEMSKEELMVRQTAALSGVNSYLIETGLWRRKNEETVKKVRDALEKVRSGRVKFYYYNVGGFSVEKMISTVKRFYFSRVGRGNPMILSFDYIKSVSGDSNKNEWQIIGDMVDAFKKLIQKEILFDGKPMISLFTSVQSNRTGVVGNRAAENVVDDESIVSLSDRIIHFSSHMFILRKKTLDERAEEPGFGTHKLINIKARHLGKQYKRALEPVRMQDGSLKKNDIHLNIENFNVEEMGDQVDLVRALGVDVDINPAQNNDDPIPG